MSTPSPSTIPKDDSTSLNVLGNLTVAELLLVSKTFVLDCWAAEEFALKNGKSKKMSARSLLNGALVRIAATEQLAQITFGDRNRKGRRELELQNLKPASVHDIMDYPWPYDSASRKVFEEALAESVELERIKPMHVLKVATTLHRLEQAKYWSDLKQRHTSQVLAAKQRSAIEGQMADCMRSTDAPPAAELVAMVQAACEEEEPGEVSEGRRALQRHLQDIKQRQQAGSMMQLPAAPTRPGNRSAGSSPDQEGGHHNKTSPGLPSAPHSKALKGSSDPGVSQSQEGMTTPQSATGKVAVTYASESPDGSQADVHKLGKPCNDTHLQSRVSSRDQQSGSHGPSTSGTEQHRRRQQASDANGSTAAHAHPRPVSAHTPGRAIPIGPVNPFNGHVSILASNPSPAVKHMPTHAASDATKRVSPPADASGHVPQHEPVAESPGIITSATIAQLASHSAAPQPLNGKSITTLGANRGNIRAIPTHSGKRKSSDTHQLGPDSSGSKGQPTSTTPPSSKASSSLSSSSLDQPAAGKRKRITWDPQAALSQQAATQAQQQPPLCISIHLPAVRDLHAQPSNSAAPSNRSRLPPGLPLVRPPGSSSENLPQTQAEVNSQKINRHRPGKEEVGTAGGRGTGHPEFGVMWSWGSGAAVQGHFGAGLVSMLPGAVGDQESGASIPPCELTFARILQRDEAQQRQLAGTACAGVYLVHCKGMRPGSSHKASDSPVTGAVHSETAGAVSDLMEHARLYGCLESSGAALALCSTSKAYGHQKDGKNNANAEVTLKAAAASKHKPPHQQPAGLHDSHPPRQPGTASDPPAAAPTAPFSFRTASRDEATQALAGVGLAQDLVQALVANFTPEQLQACLENAQQMEGEKPTGTQVTPPSGTHSGVKPAGPNPAASAVAGSSGQRVGGQPGTAPQVPTQADAEATAEATTEAAAEAAADDQGGSLVLEALGAAGRCDVWDAAPHFGVLLVSGSHVQHWLAATNVSVQLLAPIPAACAAHSHAIFAILMYSPPDRTHAPTPSPMTTPGQPPSLPHKSHPRFAAPHTVQGLSDPFPPAPSWFVPLETMPGSLQHIIHSSLQNVQSDSEVIGRDAASQNLPLHPDGAPPEPPGSLATLPRPPQPPHQPSNQLARQIEPQTVPGSSSSDRQAPPQLSTPPDHPCQSPAKLQHPVAEQRDAASRDAVLLPTGLLSSQPAEEEKLREGQLREGQLREGQLREGQLREGQLREGQLRQGQLREGQLREGQLREGQLREGQLREGQLREGQLRQGQLREGQLREGQLREGQLRGGQLREGQLKYVSELKHPRSAGEADRQQQQKQQQQTEVGSQQLQLQWPEVSRHRPQRHANSPDDLAYQPVPPQEPAQPASAVTPPQEPGQTVPPNPSQTHPGSGVTNARGAAAKPDTHTLRQMSTVAKEGSGTGEPPKRNKLLEADKGITAPSASQLLPSQPELAGAMPSSPPVSEGGVPIRNSGNSAAAEPSLPSKSAAQALNNPATGASGFTEQAPAAAAAAADALRRPAPASRPTEEQAQQPFQAPAPAQVPSQAPAPIAATQSMPRQKKRMYRQSSSAVAAAEASTAVEAPPAAKRLKQEVRVKSEPLSDKAQEEQQQRQQAKDTTGAQLSKVREPIRHPEHPIDLPPSAVNNIFRSIQKLRLQGRGQQLASHHMDLMTHLPPLLQLRVLSKYASEVLPNGNVVKFFSLTVAAMGRRDHKIRWLTFREGTAKAYRLCDAAVSLCGRLEDSGELPARAIPTRTPQLLPVELQAAYILCVGGYCGPLPHREFADQLMVGLLGQVCIMLEELKAVEDDCKVAESNLKAAGGSPAKVHERLRQLSATRSEAQRAQHATRGSEPRQLDINSVVKGCLEGLARLRHTPTSAIDDMSMNFLQSQEPLWQLRIVSFFSCKLRTAGSASAFLTSVCKFNRDERLNNKLAWLRHTGPPLHPQTQSALNVAHKAGLLAKSVFKALPAKISVLPTDLHFAAACYALAAKSSESSPDHAPAAVEDFVRFAQDLIHKKADPGAVATHSQPTPRSTAGSASRSTSHAASQPARDDKLDKAASSHSRHRSPAAGSDTHPPPTDPHRRPPSQPPRPHTLAPQHPGSPGKHQHRPPHQGNSPRHCKHFYRVEGGCTSRNCKYYHGSHQEYVAHMAHNGLVPYSLKFASDVGRDKWMVDAAVDGLNDMMMSQRLPRGSFRECDLRPVAFLQDPSGEHGRLQLQAVKRLAEQLPTSNPVRLLQSICQQVQAQAGSGGYPPMSEGYSQAPQDVYGSRGMAPVPADPFVGTASHMPPPSFGSEQMFTGPVDFTPSPVAPPLLPLPLPFAPAPLPSEDPEDGDIPFPVLRYEEELLAGMIMLQDHAGTVDSVDQLLALQPQCSMPPELARHFQGDMRERVLNFLQTRPWLFKVNPHGGISVTRLAREGLIYKRDVITYLYSAFVDNASHVSLAEIGDRVAQPPGMQQVMMENNGLLGLMDTQLFRDDVMLQPGPFGPQDIRLLLRSSGV